MEVRNEIAQLRKDMLPPKKEVLSLSKTNVVTCKVIDIPNEETMLLDKLREYADRHGIEYPKVVAYNRA